MTTKTNSEMLKSIKSYNKVARETRAKKEGFNSSASMITYLELQISLKRGHQDFVRPTTSNVESPKSEPINIGIKPKAKTKSSDARVTIHVVDILDASGSMSGSKYDAAIKGINLGVESLWEDKANVDYTYTLCDFSNDIIFRHKMSKLQDVKDFKGETRGATALYDAIGSSIKLIQESLSPLDKVLVNIYTDGQENASRNYTGAQIAASIKDLSSFGWTFTFIGTKSDVEYAQKHLKFDSSNTLVHDNTGAGLEKAFLANSVSRAAYSSKVEAGEDVSKGFYKDIN